MTKDAMTQQPAEWAELERMAKAATPGPWTIEKRSTGMTHVSGDEGRRRLKSVCYLKNDLRWSDRNAAFIAAANPATVLKLIEAARASHTPEQPDSRSGAGESYNVTWEPDARNPNDRRMYVNGSQWAKVYGWDQSSLDARCQVLEAALSVPAQPQQPEALAEGLEVVMEWDDAEQEWRTVTDHSGQALTPHAPATRLLAEANARIADLKAQVRSAVDAAQPVWSGQLEAAEADAAKLREALESIAKNTCCDSCREAALVAAAALAQTKGRP